ncbi:hypothetical protein OAJ75_03655 [Candidatus Pelagibacter sp.]|nr:hypothetical protein [Candidatus Pelagibacter sp.]
MTNFMKKYNKSKPLMLYAAESIYLNVSNIKKNNQNISNIEAIERFTGTDLYKKISSGRFHDLLFNEIENNNFIDKESGKKIPIESLNLLKIQKNIFISRLTEFSNAYYTKSSFPLENSQNIFDLLWRTCETYELWCNEVGKKELITLKILEEDE